MEEKTWLAELCQRNNSVRGHAEPRVIEWRTVTDDEADTLRALRMVHGYYWRLTRLLPDGLSPEGAQ